MRWRRRPARRGGALCRVSAISPTNRLHSFRASIYVHCTFVAGNGRRTVVQGVVGYDRAAGAGGCDAAKRDAAKRDATRRGRQDDA